MSALQQQTVPSTLKITPEMIDKYQKLGKFIRINHPGKITTRVITGAVKAWEKEAAMGQDESIFIPEYNITGTLNNVVEALRYYGLTDAAIQDQLNNAVTKDNYQSTHKEIYDALVDNKVTNSVTKQKVSRYSLGTVVEWSLRKDIKIVSKDGKVVAIGKGAVDTKATGTRGPRYTTFTERVMGLAQKTNFGLDVSKLTVDGKLARNQKLPIVGGRSTKVTMDLGNGYILMSDNVNGLRTAVALLEHENPENVGQYDDVLRDAEARLNAAHVAKTESAAKKITPLTGGSSSSSAAPKLPGKLPGKGPMAPVPGRGSVLAPAPLFKPRPSSPATVGGSSRPSLPTVLSPRSTN